MAHRLEGIGSRPWRMFLAGNVTGIVLLVAIAALLGLRLDERSDPDEAFCAEVNKFLREPEMKIFANDPAKSVQFWRFFDNETRQLLLLSYIRCQDSIAPADE